jgi:hypothetical protein
MRNSPASTISEALATQLAAFWQGLTELERHYQAYFTTTPSRRSRWREQQPSTLAENVVLQYQSLPVRLSLHPDLPAYIAQDTRALFEQVFGART